MRSIFCISAFVATLVLSSAIALADDAPAPPAADSAPAAAAPATNAAPPAVAPPSPPLPAAQPAAEPGPSPVAPSPATPASDIPTASPPVANSPIVVAPPIETITPTPAPQVTHHHRRYYRHWRAGHPIKHDATTPGDAPAR
jgi:hypothetical protein